MTSLRNPQENPTLKPSILTARASNKEIPPWHSPSHLPHCFTFLSYEQIKREVKR